jgi:hypothetical protein
LRDSSARSAIPARRSHKQDRNWTIAEPKLRRSIARLTNRLADGVQSKTSAELLPLEEPTDEPADNT